MLRAEGVPLELEPAGAASRLLARLLDLVVCLAGLYALLTGLAAVSPPLWLMIAVAVVAVFVALFVYPAVLETVMSGRTVGKLALGLRVVTERGGTIGFRHAATRAALSVVDIIATSGFVGIAAIIVTDRRQRLGDLAAGTVVVRTRMAERDDSPVGWDPEAYASFTASLDVRQLPPTTVALARDVVRRDELRHPELLDRLALHIDQVLGGRRPVNMPSDVFLRCVIARDATMVRPPRPLVRSGLD